MHTPSYSDLEISARTVAQLGRDQSENVQSSLAWVIKNRFERILAISSGAPAINMACQAVLLEALGHQRSANRTVCLSSADWFRICALNHLVWAGDVADQTEGAIACHRHDSNPNWAKSRTPTALLGSFLFFR